jgi:hypothetical protein
MVGRTSAGTVAVSFDLLRGTKVYESLLAVEMGQPCLRGAHDHKAMRSNSA